MRRLFITGVEGATGGIWEWFDNKAKADVSHGINLNNFADIPGEKIYRGELDVPEGTQGFTTDFIETFLEQHEFENAPLINKEIITTK